MEGDICSPPDEPNPMKDVAAVMGGCGIIEELSTVVNNKVSGFISMGLSGLPKLATSNWFKSIMAMVGVVLNMIQDNNLRWETQRLIEI